MRPDREAPRAAEKADAHPRKAQVEDAALERIAALDGGGAAVWKSARRKRPDQPLGLLTAKPIIYAANVSEDDLAGGNGFSGGRPWPPRNHGNGAR